MWLEAAQRLIGITGTRSPIAARRLGDPPTALQRRVQALEFDLADPDNVRAFADEVGALAPVDAMIGNAGGAGHASGEQPATL